MTRRPTRSADQHVDALVATIYNAASMVVAPKRKDEQPDALAPVLYVEDNAINSKVVRYGLRGRYDVVVAATAREACDLVRARRDDFIAVLMDIELQGSELDGIDLTRLFRGNLDGDTLPDYAAGVRTIEVPIIIVTAYVERYTDEYLLEAGANACMRKPLDLSGLRDLLLSIEASVDPVDHAN